MSRRSPALFPNLPLFWKVLLPFLTLMVLVGAFGVFLIVRDLSSRAQATLDQELARHELASKAALRDRELYLLESANFAANVEPMATALRAGDDAAVGRLLQSVLALKTELAFVAAVDRTGVGRVEFTRAAANAPVSFGRGTPWSSYDFVSAALSDQQGRKFSDFLQVGDSTLFAVAAPVCTVTDGCAPVGGAVVGVAVQDLALAAAGNSSGGLTEEGGPAGSALYDLDGRVLAATGVVARRSLPPELATSSQSKRHTDTVDGTEIATVYAAFDVQGSRLGTVALSVPTASASGTVRGAAIRLIGIVLLAMAGIVAIGAALSRTILAQVKPLVETNRALGRGELSARAPVYGDDELGELARGVNQMAEQLQASYETLEVRVDERTEEVRRLLRDRTEFFAGLSHELRTPLAIILAQIDRLTNEEDAPGRTEAADTIRASAEELLTMVNDVLDLARAEAGTTDVELESVSLQEVLDTLAPTLVKLGAASDVHVEIDIPTELPLVTADPARVRVMLINLVDNAIKYTPPGGRILVSASLRRSHVEVTVADTGIGIPAEVGERVFEPFYRVPGSRPQRGQASSGLGLALTRRWVEAQGGVIDWSPNPGGGTIFRFTLPVERARPQRRTARSVSRGAAPSS